VWATDQLQQSYRSVNGSTTVGVANSAATFNSNKIEEWGNCKKIASNTCGADVFIPTASSPEWSAFVSNHPSCITLTDCPPEYACAFADIILCSTNYNACQIWQ